MKIAIQSQGMGHWYGLPQSVIHRFLVIYHWLIEWEQLTLDDTKQIGCAPESSFISLTTSHILHWVSIAFNIGTMDCVSGWKTARCAHIACVSHLRKYNVTSTLCQVRWENWNNTYLSWPTVRSQSLQALFWQYWRRPHHAPLHRKVEPTPVITELCRGHLHCG